MKNTNIKQTCHNCIFNDDANNKCFVGTHYANKGLNRICIEGELWEAKSDKVKIFTPEFLKEIGFTMVHETKSEYHPFMYFGRAKDKIGLTHILWNEEGHFCTYFGDRLQPNTSIEIRKDGDTRTVFYGYVFSRDEVRLLLKLTL